VGSIRRNGVSVGASDSGLTLEQGVNALLNALARSRRLMTNKLAKLRSEGNVEDANHELTVFEIAAEDAPPSPGSPFVVSGHVEVTRTGGDIFLWWLEVKRGAVGWTVDRGLTVNSAPIRTFEPALVSDSTSLAALLPQLTEELLASEPRT
jgi:hypothetical protein